ncbi:MAG: hypothetical protein WCQ76_04480 [Fusobacterium sp.]
MKTFVVGLVITLVVFGVNKNYLSRIEKLEGQVKFEKKQVEICNKQLRKQMMSYYNKSNFKKIELEMLDKGKMEHSKEIRYFKLEGEKEDVEGN